MAAIVGAAGLAPTLAAARAGKKVLLANKEALVMSGQLFMDAVHDNGATLLPIDSEHNAIFQCCRRLWPRARRAAGVAKIVLTASGGPFLHARRRDARQRDAGRGLQASELGHGPQDFGRFGHHDEQGPGSDRGALAVRRAGRPDRGA